MRFLLVGAAAVDTVLRVSEYPLEDQELRASGLSRSLGGNAANTARVLSQYGHHVEWAGVRGDDVAGQWLANELDRLGIARTREQCLSAKVTPSSYISLSAATGSRTIVHYRDLPEYAEACFRGIELDGFDWVHFEGRPGDDLAPMLERAVSAGRRCSLEVEKPRDGIENLFELPSLLLFSRPYAEARGCRSAESFLGQLPPGARLASCTWGDRGSWIRDRSGRISHVPAVAPPLVVDTLAAGDAYNAGVLHWLVAGAEPVDAAGAACELAGRACSQYGLEKLVRDEERV